MLASQTAWEKIELYLDVLRSWSTRINLIARGDRGLLGDRHVGDSLAVLALLPAGASRLVDLGTGAGFPGMPVAIASGIETHLIDRDQRKCAFLREAARRTGAPVVVHAGDFGACPPLGADVILSRATAKLAMLLDGALRHARKGGVMVLHKSLQQADEIEVARRSWAFDIQVFRNPVGEGGRLWRVAGFARRGE